MTSMYVQQSVFRLDSVVRAALPACLVAVLAKHPLLRSYADADFLTPEADPPRHHRQRKHCRAPYGDGKQREWGGADDLIDEERQRRHQHRQPRTDAVNGRRYAGYRRSFRRRCCDCD